MFGVAACPEAAGDKSPFQCSNENDPELSETEDGTNRRRAAKRAKEALKLTATLLNNLAVGILVAGLISPSAAGRSLPIGWYGALICVAIGLHWGGRIVLRRLKSEE